jgi:hypothetical protein
MVATFVTTLVGWTSFPIERLLPHAFVGEKVAEGRMRGLRTSATPVHVPPFRPD